MDLLLLITKQPKNYLNNMANPTETIHQRLGGFWSSPILRFIPVLNTIQSDKLYDIAQETLQQQPHQKDSVNHKLGEFWNSSAIRFIPILNTIRSDKIMGIAYVAISDKQDLIVPDLAAEEENEPTPKSLALTCVEKPSSGTILLHNKNNALKLVDDADVKWKDAPLKWDDYPLYLNQYELSTMNFDHIVSILQKDVSVHPITNAGLGGESLCDILTRIKGLYEDALIDYQKKLQEAFPRDTGNNKIAKRMWTGVFREVKPAFLRNILSKAALMASGILNHSKPEGSYHRKKWLIYIDIKESDRLKQARDMIQNRSSLLHEELEEFREQNPLLYQENIVNELLQLNKVFKNLFPKEELMLSDTLDLTQYLKQYEIEETEITA